MVLTNGHHKSSLANGNVIRDGITATTKGSLETSSDNVEMEEEEEEEEDNCSCKDSALSTNSCVSQTVKELQFSLHPTFTVIKQSQLREWL